MSITLEDIRQSLLNRGDSSVLSDPLKKAFKNPPLAEIKTNPTALLKPLHSRLAKMVERWMDGNAPSQKGKTGINIQLKPVIPYGRNLSTYIEDSIDQFKPDVVALDTSPVTGLGAGNFHAFSCYNMVGLPLPVETLSSEGVVLDKSAFFSGSLLETTIIKCYLEHIPLVPIGLPARKTPSRTEQIFQQLLEEVHEEFDQALNTTTYRDIHTHARQLTSHIWDSGHSVINEEREYLIDECCYLASRIAELSTLLKKGSRILLFTEVKHLTDLEPLLNTLKKSAHFWEEFYQPPLKIREQSHYQASEEKLDPLWEYAKTKGPSTTLCQRLFQKSFQRWAKKIMHEPLSPSSADRFITHILEATRNHSEIERGAGVRGSLALKAVAQGYSRLGKGLNRLAFYRASMVTLPHRILMRPGSERKPSRIIKEISQEVLYGIRYSPGEQQRKPARPVPLTRENLKQALEGLTDAALTHTPDPQSFSSQDWALAQEAMKHPLVQEALQNANYPAESQEALNQLLEELEKSGFLEHLTPDQYTLTEKGKEALRESVKQRAEKGELSPEQMKEMLNHLKNLPASGSAITMNLPQDKMSKFLSELMDAQHQGRSLDTSLEDIYVHYTLSEKKGIKTDSAKLDYQKLQIMIHQLEEKGLLKVSGTRMKHYTLTSRALSWLLEELIPKDSSNSLTKHAFKKEHEIEKAEVRRYQKGDVYRDISIRHTLKEMIKQGKTPEDIGQKEFRSFDKKPSAQLDIVLCVDVSASMKEQSKLRYAKLALAGLAKAALDKKDRVGIVAFSNVGNVVTPLSDDYQAVMDSVIRLRADQYTNIGNGLLRARNMLLSDKSGNSKHIVLITDGQPNATLADIMKSEEITETEEKNLNREYRLPDSRGHEDQPVNIFKGDDWKIKEQLGTRHALMEARKIRDKDIKISVLLITHQDELGKWVTRKIAQIGRGKFYKVKTIESIPLDALQMFQ
jgi:Mg-chelatase subunit ChlD/predicted transcriptional regulator